MAQCLLGSGQFNKYWGAFKVASLPTANLSQGDAALITDATTPAFAAAPVGGGAIICPVYWTGTTWLCGG
jgi:hypothetical protein